ncbi:MAG: septum formation initiator family protein [Eubacteriales bacterium]|nr:septum formation initiator family protein [Eubacteriales bacterium]
MKSRRKRKVNPLVVLVAAVALFTVAKLVSFQLQLSDLQQQSRNLDEEIALKQVQNAELKESLDEGVTDESIAKIARDVLGYASPGERVFIDSSEQ